MIISEIPPIRKQITSIKCDRCKTIHEDIIDIQEYLIYEDVSGYGATAYTDGDVLELHLCQDCKKDVLGEYIRIVKSW